MCKRNANRLLFFVCLNAIFLCVPFFVLAKIPVKKTPTWFDLKSQVGIVKDLDSGKILYAKNSDDKRPIASLTKLMTALVFLEEKVPWGKKMTIKASENVIGGKLRVMPNEEVTVKDLFYASLVGSANNATIALVRSTGLPSPKFVARMNAKAKKMGMENTHFVDVTGLDPRNISTAFDLTKLVFFAFKNEEIQKASSAKEYVFYTLNTKKLHRLINTNQLLRKNLLNIIGGKTGYLDESGYNLIVAAKGENGVKIATVVLGSKSKKQIFQEVKDLTNWVFKHYTWK